MGFRFTRTMRLAFAGDLEGLEIKVSSVAFDELMTFLGLELRDPESTKILAGTIVEWNYEDETGKPVAATSEGLRSLPPPVLRAIISAWTEAQAGVSAPLHLGSTSGEEPSNEMASLPMENLL